MTRIAPLLTPDMDLSEYMLREVTLPTSYTRSFLLTPILWDGENQHALIPFTVEGIVLQGPLVLGIEAKGMVSESKKTLDWFHSELTEDEVCEAFLHQRWQYTVAERDLRVLAGREQYSPGKQEFLRGLADRIARCEGDRNSLTLTLRTTGGIDFVLAGQVGVDYPMPEAGWLCAIQRRFAIYWREKA